jgi:two-component system, OmpR family, response regulator ChvI
MAAEAGAPPTIAFFEREDQMGASAGLRAVLEADGYRTIVYNDGKKVLDGLKASPAALLVCEIKVPGMDGMELLRRLRRKTDMPIVFLTSKDEEIDQIFGMKMGADAYFTKPYSDRVVAAHIKALLYRSQHGDYAKAEGRRGPIERGRLRMDPERHTCDWDGQPVSLTVTEFLILQELASRPGMVKSRNALMDAAYGDQVYVDDRTIDSHIARLRKKFGQIDASFKAIETLKGVGYRYAEVAPPSASPAIEQVEQFAGFKQSTLGATFVIETDQLVIGPSGDATDAIAARSPHVQALHSEVRRKASGFRPIARRLDNQYGWRGTGSALDRLIGLLDDDTAHVAEHVGEVWSSVVELGSFLELDQQLVSNPETANSALDADVRRQFFDLLRTASPFVRQFPTARQLDDESGAFLSRRKFLEQATEVVRQAGHAELLAASDRKMLEALVAAAERGDFQGVKADSRVCNSARNLIIVGAGIVASFYMGSTASYHSNYSSIAKKAGDAILAAERPILRLFEDAPGDLRLALQSLMERLKANRDKAPGDPSVPREAVNPVEQVRREGC